MVALILIAGCASKPIVAPSETKFTELEAQTVITPVAKISVEAASEVRAVAERHLEITLSGPAEITASAREVVVAAKVAEVRAQEVVAVAVAVDAENKILRQALLLLREAYNALEKKYKVLADEYYNRIVERDAAILKSEAKIKERLAQAEIERQALKDKAERERVQGEDDIRRQVARIDFIISGICLLACVIGVVKSPAHRGLFAIGALFSIAGFGLGLSLLYYFKATAIVGVVGTCVSIAGVILALGWWAYKSSIDAVDGERRETIVQAIDSYLVEDYRTAMEKMMTLPMTRAIAKERGALDK